MSLYKMSVYEMTVYEISAYEMTVYDISVYEMSVCSYLPDSCQTKLLVLSSLQGQEDLSNKYKLQFK